MTDIELEYSVKDNSGRRVDLELDFTGEKSFVNFAEGIRNAVMRLATEALAENQREGFDKNPRVRVDNRFDVPISSVKHFGKIEYFARRDALLAVAKMYVEILKRSPRLTGLYKKSHYVFYNRQLVATDAAELRGWIKQQQKKGVAENDVIRIVNVTPYARRLELGGITRALRGKSKGKVSKSKKRKGKSRAGNIINRPHGAYALAFRVIKDKFRALGKVLKFTMMPNGTDGINIEAGTSPITGKKMRTSFISGDRPYLFPTIVLRLDGRGIDKGVNFE